MLAQFHGGPWDGRTMRMPRPWPPIFRVPVAEPITVADVPSDRPGMSVVEYSNEWMAPYGRPDIYVIRKSDDHEPR